MATETLQDRDFIFVSQDEDDNVVHCYVVVSGVQGTNPIGILTKAEPNGRYLVEMRVTGQEGVITNDQTLEMGQQMLIGILKAKGVLPAIAVDVTIPETIIVTSDAEDDEVMIPVSGSVTCQLSAECLPEGTKQEVTWDIETPATGVSIDDETGLATFLSTTVVATVTFLAYSVYDDSIVGEIVITCTQV